MPLAAPSAARFDPAAALADPAAAAAALASTQRLRYLCALETLASQPVELLVHGGATLRGTFVATDAQQSVLRLAELSGDSMLGVVGHVGVRGSDVWALDWKG